MHRRVRSVLRVAVARFLRTGKGDWIGGETEIIREEYRPVHQEVRWSNLQLGPG